MNNGNVTVENKTPYVVRMEQKAKLLPSGKTVQFAKAYILPGEKISASAKEKITSAEKQIEIYPVSRYGYQVQSYLTDLQE